MIFGGIGLIANVGGCAVFNAGAMFVGPVVGAGELTLLVGVLAAEAMAEYTAVDAIVRVGVQSRRGIGS